MRILIVFTYNYSLKTWLDSNVLHRELSIYKRINSLNESKFILLTYGDKSDLEINIDKEIFDVVPVYKYLKYNSNKFIRFISSFLIPFKLKKQLKDVSIIKQHQILGIWVSVILKKVLKKPLFVRTGYDMYKFSLKDNKKYIVKTFYKFLNFLGYRFGDLYTVSNEEDYQDLKQKFENSSKFIKRPNWILQNNISLFENRYHNKVLFVGRLEEQKNVRELLYNFSGTNFEIVIYGEGSLKKDLIKFSKENNVNVDFKEALPNDQLGLVYNKFKFFVTTSLFEGNPKTVLEAMSNGCIVFASDIPAHTELISDLDTGIIFPLGNKNLYNIFSKIVEDKKLLLSISSNAINEIKNNFDLNIAAEKEIRDYKFLL